MSMRKSFIKRLLIVKSLIKDIKRPIERQSKANKLENEQKNK